MLLLIAQDNHGARKWYSIRTRLSSFDDIIYVHALSVPRVISVSGTARDETVLKLDFAHANVTLSAAKRSERLHSDGRSSECSVGVLGNRGHGVRGRESITTRPWERAPHADGHHQLEEPPIWRNRTRTTRDATAGFRRRQGEPSRDDTDRWISTARDRADHRRPGPNRDQWYHWHKAWERTQTTGFCDWQRGKVTVEWPVPRWVYFLAE